jgi:2-hydroxychromene-2-carboxylate isomerase
MLATNYDFFFDFASPYSYLASTQLRGIAERIGEWPRLYPVVLGGVRKAMGRDMPPPAQLAYMRQDTARWAERYGVQMQIPASFPEASSILALRACVAAGRTGNAERAMPALFAAHWVKGLDFSKPEVVVAALDEAGLPGKELVAQTQQQEVKDELRKNTDLALARGVFGVPTIFVGERSFWGNDRLEWVESALRRARLGRT